MKIVSKEQNNSSINEVLMLRKKNTELIKKNKRLEMECREANHFRKQAEDHIEQLQNKIISYINNAS